MIQFKSEVATFRQHAFFIIGRVDIRQLDNYITMTTIASIARLFNIFSVASVQTSNRQNDNHVVFENGVYYIIYI